MDGDRDGAAAGAEEDDDDHDSLGGEEAAEGGGDGKLKGLASIPETRSESGLAPEGAPGGGEGADETKPEEPPPVDKDELVKAARDAGVEELERLLIQHKTDREVRAWGVRHRGSV
jgi:hypothetical protein